MIRNTAVVSRLLERIAVLVGLAAIVLTVLVAVPSAGNAAQTAGVRSEDVSFRSGDVTLHGSILVPDTAGPHPAMALLAGSGAGPRDKYRLEAEAFARAGIATLIFDKRTSGYSTSERSYALLSDDALAAVNLLRDHSDIDASAVGLWGHSEGAWVASLAASRSSDVAFVVTVGAAAVPGAQQTVWALRNRLDNLGVSGSMANAYLPAMIRLAVSAGAFPEADYDGVETWENVQQPVLAVWGTQDHTVPPAESSQIVAQALERGGNQQLTIRFVPGEHAAHTTPDGFERDDVLAPGYAEAVTSWVHSVADGDPQPGVVEDPPVQDHHSTPITPIAWHQSAWAQFALLGVLVTAFLAYPVTALIRKLRRRAGPPPSPVTRAARWVAAAGLLTALAVPAFVVLVLSGNIGPVVAGRPIPWLVLHTLALATVVSAARVAIGWRSATTVQRADQPRVAALLVGAALFVPWAVYWGALLP